VRASHKWQREFERRMGENRCPDCRKVFSPHKSNILCDRCYDKATR
jgi:Zn finger protein HypA/HybF involved in hydrogenase expression